MRSTGAPPVQYQPRYSAPIEQAVGESCNCGSSVPAGDCGCNQWLPANIEQAPFADYAEPAYDYQGPAAVDSSTDSLAAPVVQSQVNVNTGDELDASGLLSEPPLESEPVPYVEPKFDPVPLQIDGVAVPALDADTGFLSPQGLSGSEEELAQDDSVEENPNDFDSVLGPTEAESVGQNILQSNDEAHVVVLKARPVSNHRVNNLGVLRPAEAIANDRTDSYGLPTDSSVQFAELPPLGNGTRPWPVSFERNPKPPVKHLQDVECRDKSTQAQTGKIYVAESTTNQPSDTEPMLRMTAIPYSGNSSLGSAIARIKVGKTPLIVRGEYPRDLEYERLARERNEQAARSVIIPNTSLKTIDR